MAFFSLRVNTQQSQSLSIKSTNVSSIIFRTVLFVDSIQTTAAVSSIQDVQNTRASFVKFRSFLSVVNGFFMRFTKNILDTTSSLSRIFGELSTGLSIIIAQIQNVQPAGIILDGYYASKINSSIVKLNNTAYNMSASLVSLNAGLQIIISSTTTLTALFVTNNVNSTVILHLQTAISNISDVVSGLQTQMTTILVSLQYCQKLTTPTALINTLSGNNLKALNTKVSTNIVVAKSFLAFSQLLNADQTNNAFVTSLLRIKNEFNDVIVRPIYPDTVILVDAFSTGLVTVYSSLFSKFGTLVDLTYAIAYENAISQFSSSIQTRSDDLVTYLIGFLAKSLGKSIVCFDRNINTAIIALQILAIDIFNCFSAGTEVVYIAQQNLTATYESLKLNATYNNILLSNCITSSLKTTIILTAIKTCFQNVSFKKMYNHKK